MPDYVPHDDGRGPTPEELAAANFAMQPGVGEKLQDALNLLSDIADKDCYGPYRDPNHENRPCDCEVCCAKQVQAVLESIRLPVVRSLRPDRLNYAEKVYFDAWVKQNTRAPGLNGGYGTLELLLRQVNKQEAVRGHVFPAYVSQRDMDVATVVVQWLGTNVGRCFVDTAEKVAKEKRESFEDFEHITHVAQHWAAYAEKPTYTKIAESIAERFFPGKATESQLLVSYIVRAMLYAKCDAQSKAALSSLQADAESPV